MGNKAYRYQILFVLMVQLMLNGCSSPKRREYRQTLRAPLLPLILLTSDHRLKISLDSTFPETCLGGAPLRANYEAVAQDVLEAFQSRFTGASLYDIRPILCYVSQENVPRTDATLDVSVIKIGIAIPLDDLNALDYDRFAYQLSHELGHVMLGARRTNGFIETLGDAISYQVLADLSMAWPKKYADYRPWKDYAPSFLQYRSQREQEYLMYFPKQIQIAVSQQQWGEVTSYLRSCQPELDRDPYSQKGLALRSLGAMALLSGSVDWQAFGGITMLTSPTPQEDQQNHFDLPIDLTRAPQSVRAAVARFR